MGKRDFNFKRLRRSKMYSVYLVTVPLVITSRSEKRNNYINNIVIARTGKKASDIYENGQYTFIKIIRHRKTFEETHKVLRYLVNDFWSNNILRNALGH